MVKGLRNGAQNLPVDITQVMDQLLSPHGSLLSKSTESPTMISNSCVSMQVREEMRNRLSFYCRTWQNARYCFHVHLDAKCEKLADFVALDDIALRTSNLPQLPNFTNVLQTLQFEMEKTSPGSFKLNVDAANDRNTKATGLGFILRDSNGEFVAAMESRWKGYYHPKLAEAIGIRL
nr:Ribonuclease H-like domain containing protein [Ipomoea batatas]